MKMCGVIRNGRECVALIDERFSACVECREALLEELEGLAGAPEVAVDE